MDGLVAAVVVSGFVVLVVSGARHLRWRRVFVQQLHQQGLWPARAVPGLARLVTALELAVGVGGLCLVVAGARAAIALVALLVVGAGFVAAQVVLARRAPDAPCGCDPTHDDPVGGASLARAAWPAVAGVVGLLALPDGGVDAVLPAAVGLGVAALVDSLPILVRSAQR